jgi:DNA helicase HerA-like ATPase
MHLFLGTLERDKSQAVELSAAARIRHFAVLGKSGVGKTTLFRNMIVSDLCSGVGVTVLDPHGGLVNDLLSLIPRHRANDVIRLFESEASASTSLNCATRRAASCRAISY